MAEQVTNFPKSAPSTPGRFETGKDVTKQIKGGKAIDQEKMREDLEMIRKALDLIDDRVFLILNSVEIKSARGWVAQYRRAHDELGEMITHLADLAGIQEDEDEDEE